MARTFPTILSSLSFPLQKRTKNLVPNPIPETNYIISSLKSCSNSRDFSLIHAHLITTNLIRDPLVASHVLWFFVSRGNSQYAHRVLSQNPELEATLWNTLLENHLKDEYFDEVFLTYSHMVTQGVSLDISTFHFLIHACSRSLNFQRGIEVHGRLIKLGMARNKSLNNNLMGFYSKFKRLKEVRQLFDKISHRDVITWNTMISCSVQMGMHREALDLLDEMLVDGIAADEVTMISLLSACSRLRDLETGEKLHRFIDQNRLKIGGNLLNCLVNMYIECGKMDRANEIVANCESVSGDVVLMTSLVGGYVKEEKISAARCVFDRIEEKNLISWMTMISGYFQLGHYRETLELFREMRLRDSVFDEILLVTVLSACTNKGDFKLGRSIHALVVKCGFVVEGLMGNSLVDLYSKREEPNEARLIFDNLNKKTIASWNSMLDSLCRSGDIEKAKSFFAEIPEKDVISWNTLIKTLVKSSRFEELFELFREMQRSSSVKPDKLTLISILSSCANMGALSHGIWVHTYIEKNRIVIDEMLGTSLIDMYAKCGCVDKSRELFLSLLTDKKNKNVFIWTAMITAHAMEGQAEEAIDLFTEMEKTGISPDRVTFIALLSACSHGGLVDKGIEYFDKMRTVHGINPDIQLYGCIVDLLGRAGRLDEAMRFIDLMPCHIKPDLSIWSSLLRSSCHSRRNIEIAELAFRQLIELDPKNDSAHVLLSNAYAKAGRSDNFRQTRKALFDLGIRKIPGRSVIEQDGTVYEFTASDFSNPRSPEIYALLKELTGKFEEIGIEETSCHHSERLAVGFGLINSLNSTPIRVVNNLRICGDCHSAMKVMSKVYNTEIVIRDNYRFHRFVDGNCTCKDYW